MNDMSDRTEMQINLVHNVQNHKRKQCNSDTDTKVVFSHTDVVDADSLLQTKIDVSVPVLMDTRNDTPSHDRISAIQFSPRLNQLAIPLQSFVSEFKEEAKLQRGENSLYTTTQGNFRNKDIVYKQLHIFSSSSSFPTQEAASAASRALLAEAEWMVYLHTLLSNDRHISVARLVAIIVTTPTSSFALPSTSLATAATISTVTTTTMKATTEFDDTLNKQCHTPMTAEQAEPAIASTGETQTQSQTTSISSTTPTYVCGLAFQYVSGFPLLAHTSNPVVHWLQRISYLKNVASLFSRMYSPPPQPSSLSSSSSSSTSSSTSSSSSTSTSSSSTSVLSTDVSSSSSSTSSRSATPSPSPSPSPPNVPMRPSTPTPPSSTSTSSTSSSSSSQQRLPASASSASNSSSSSDDEEMLPPSSENNNSNSNSNSNSNGNSDHSLPPLPPLPERLLWPKILVRKSTNEMVIVDLRFCDQLLRMNNRSSGVGSGSGRSSVNGNTTEEGLLQLTQTSTTTTPMLIETPSFASTTTTTTTTTTASSLGSLAAAAVDNESVSRRSSTTSLTHYFPPEQTNATTPTSTPPTGFRHPRPFVSPLNNNNNTNNNEDTAMMIMSDLSPPLWPTQSPYPSPSPPPLPLPLQGFVRTTESRDVYAYGILIPEILTGHVWDISSETQRFDPQHMTIPRLEPLPPKYHEHVIQMVRACMSVDPLARPSFDDVVALWDQNLGALQLDDDRKADDKQIALLLKEKGNKAFANGRYPEALQIFTQALQLDEFNEVYYSNRSATYAALCRWLDALEDADTAVRLKPNWFKPYLRRGAALEALLRYHEAEESYRRGLACENDESLVRALADLNKILSDIRVAETELATSANNHPDLEVFQRMVKWVKDGGGQFPKLSWKYISEGNRGVQAITPVHSNEVMIFIPVKCIMSSDLAKRSSIGFNIISSSVELRNRHSYLASYLLQEKHKGTESFWYPFIQTLPTHYRNMPIYFDDDTLGLLKGSFTLQKIADRIDSLKREYDALRKHVVDFKDFTFDEFVWARMVVITRTYGLDIGGMKTDGLVPFADLLNHRRPRDTKWTFDDGRGGFVLTSLRATAKGEEICCSYGPKCNARYFVNYGFTLDDNGSDNEALIRVCLPPRQEGNEALFDKKLLLLGGRQAAARREFQIPANYKMKKTKELFSFMRFAHATTEQLNALTAVDAFRVDDIEPFAIDNEILALHAISEACQWVLKGFDTTYEEDVKLLESNELPLYSNARNCVVMRKGEKEVLRSLIELETKGIPMLNSDWKDVKRAAVPSFQLRNNLDAYVISVIAPLVKHAFNKSTSNTTTSTTSTTSSTDTANAADKEDNEEQDI